MKKKLLSLILGLVLCLGVVPGLTGCGKKADLSVLLMVNSTENQFYEKHFQQMGEELGITIEYTGIAFANYYDKLRSEINGGTIPDIFYVRPSDLRERIADEHIADIESLVAAQTDVQIADIYDSAFSSYRYNASTKQLGNGNLYAVPKDLSVQQLGYNKTLIQRKAQYITEELGLKLPWEMDWATENYTWDEYKAMAACLTDTSDKNNPVYGCDIPNIEILTWSFGGNIVENDTVQLNSDAFKQAVQYQADLISDGAANYQGATYDNFVAGKVAFYGETNSFDIKAFDETFARLDMEWDVMPWPVAEGAEPTDWTGKITSAGYAVSSECADKETAVKVMMSLLTPATQNKLVAQEKLMLPLYKKVAEETYVSEQYDDVYSPKSREVYIDVISGKNGKFSIDYSCYSLTWQKTYTDYLETIAAAAGDKVQSLIKSAAEYDALNASVQTAYNKDNVNK